MVDVLLLGTATAVRSFSVSMRANRGLTWELVKREIGERYAGQMLGTFWVIGHPLILMGVYVFIFSFVLKVKIASTYDLPLDYTAYILSGLIPWIAFHESMAKSCTVISGNAGLVKQVIFPIEVLPVKSVIASLTPLLVGLTVLSVYVIASSGGLPWTYVLIPVLLLLQTLAMIGVAYILASLGVYFRDLKDVVLVLTLISMYLMPIFYLPDWVPDLFKPVIFVNPFSYMIWCYQDALYFGRFEHPWAWAIFGLGAPVALSFGYRLFITLKTQFGNVL